MLLLGCSTEQVRGEGTGLLSVSAGNKPLPFITWTNLYKLIELLLAARA